MWRRSAVARQGGREGWATVTVTEARLRTMQRVRRRQGGRHRRAAGRGQPAHSPTRMLPRCLSTQPLPWGLGVFFTYLPSNCSKGVNFCFYHRLLHNDLTLLKGRASQCSTRSTQRFLCREKRHSILVGMKCGCPTVAMKIREILNVWNLSKTQTICFESQVTGSQPRVVGPSPVPYLPHLTRC
ncbi:hypothetical protein E2C01_039926 [Portunus trituberculatus]|uniref:Uncharacterized protein n=1 Tax=Portunus trituberculatus TaxID=210409 RepID=A0A5B7FPC5_PORTR|nr:hypothetical protein [Portunus trituberculatus]